MKTKQLPPYAPTLIESTRAIGYTLETAIADIVDNSVSASATCVDIYYFPKGDPYVAILDDGTGMDSETIDRAMRYGSYNPNDVRAVRDLGRFGLGLKTASLSQCRTLTVVSKQGDSVEARRWDIDHVVSSQDWSLLVLESDEEIHSIPDVERLLELPSGTLVVWQNLDLLGVGESDFARVMGQKMDVVRTHLSLVFHRYIAGEQGIRKLQVRMNEAPVEPVDPFLVKRNTQVMSAETMIIGGAKVVVRSYLLPHLADMTESEKKMLGGKDGLRKNQGFYVYRNKRLVTWGTWFRMMRKAELSKLARVQVDIPNELDSLWTLDIKKSTVVPPEDVRKNLEATIERLAQKSKRTWVFRGKRETDRSIVHIWECLEGRNGVRSYVVNREHPLVAALLAMPLPIRQQVECLLKTVEKGLPLNSLYVDVTEDRSIGNEEKPDLAEVAQALKALLANAGNAATRENLLRRAAVSEPFVQYPELLKSCDLEGSSLG